MGGVVERNAVGGVEQGVEITAGQAILSGQEQKDDPARRITRDAPRCPVKLIRELLFNGEQWARGGEAGSLSVLPWKYSTRFR